MMRQRLFCSVALAGVCGSALPGFGVGSAAAAPVAQAVEAESVHVAPPVVQVRDFWRSSVVSVVAWDVEEASFGLRAAVSRNGTLVGGHRFGDHVLYLTPFHVWYMGGFAHAMAVPGKPLLRTGWQSDPYSCYYGTHCSPMVTVGVRVPDALLRANRDSLVVTFLRRAGDPWTLTLRGELIAAYLAKVDSVVVEMRKSGTD